MSHQGRAHREGCWNDHHECAVAEIRRLLGECRRLTDSLTDDEVRTIIHSARDVRGGSELSEDDARVLVAWGNKVRKSAAALEAVLKGYISVDVRDGRPQLLANDRSAEIVEAAAAGRLPVIPTRP